MKNTDTKRFIKKKKTCRHLNVCHCCNFEEKPLSSSLKPVGHCLRKNLGIFVFLFLSSLNSLDYGGMGYN